MQCKYTFNLSKLVAFRLLCWDSLLADRTLYIYKSFPQVPMSMNIVAMQIGFLHRKANVEAI